MFNKLTVFVIGAAAVLPMIVPFTAHAAAPSSGQTPITQCDSLPPTAAIEVFTTSDVVPLCRQVLRVLDGVTVKDLRSSEVASYLLSAKGYKPGEYAQITAELVDIIRLRGLYNKEPRWKPTLELVWTSYEAFHGIVTPSNIVSLLKSSGPLAKTLSDDGLTNMIILMKEERQQGNE